MDNRATSRGVTHGLTPYLLYLLLTSTLGPALFGYHLAELNAPQAVITCERKKITNTAISTFARLTNAFGHNEEVETAAIAGLPQCIPMSPPQLGAVSSLYTLGGLFGALRAGHLSGKYGRLKTMLFTTVFFTIGPVFEALAPNIATMSFGRFVSGLGAGASMVVVPIYISEIAPPDKRGLFGSLTQVMVNGGIFIAQLLGFFLSRDQLWRIILAAAGLIGLLKGVGLMLGGQESPRWMAEQGKPSRARKALQRIRGQNVDIGEEIEAWGTDGTSHDPNDEEETLLASEDRMQHYTADNLESPSVGAAQSPLKSGGYSSEHQPLGMLAVLTNPESRTAIIAIVMVMCAQQLCGINSIVMYGVELLAELLAANSALLNVVVSVVNIFFTAGAAPLVDKLGRKTCLLMSISGMGSMSVVLAFGIMKGIPMLSAVAVLLFVASFGLGLGPVPFILASELVNSDAVGATQSWALGANWIATFMVAQFFPILNKKMGKGEVYFIFAAFAVFFGTFVAFKLPETKGKRDADEVWGRTKASARED